MQLAENSTSSKSDTVASSASVRFVMTGCTMCVLLATVY